MEVKKSEAKTILGLQSPGGAGRLEDTPVCLQYLDQTHALCELVMPASEAMRLLGFLQGFQRHHGLSIPVEPRRRH